MNYVVRRGDLMKEGEVRVEELAKCVKVVVVPDEKEADLCATLGFYLHQNNANLVFLMQEQIEMRKVMKKIEKRMLEEKRKGLLRSARGANKKT